MDKKEVKAQKALGSCKFITCPNCNKEFSAYGMSSTIHTDITREPYSTDIQSISSGIYFCCPNCNTRIG